MSHTNIQTPQLIISGSCRVPYGCDVDGVEVLIITRLISIVSKPIKLICGQTNFDEKKSQFLVKNSFGFKKLLGQK